MECLAELRLILSYRVVLNFRPVKIGLHRAPESYLVEGCISPMLLSGGPWTRILFPRALWGTLDAAGRRALIVHELAHFQRGDHWVRWLETVCRCLYWWHPAVWWAIQQIERSEEECCDAVVVSLELPRTYADAIVSTLDFLADKERSLPRLACGLHDVPALRKRLTQIMRRSVSPQVSGVARCVLTAFCAGTLAIHPSLHDVRAVGVQSLAAKTVATLNHEVGLLAEDPVDQVLRQIDARGGPVVKIGRIDPAVG